MMLSEHWRECSDAALKSLNPAPASDGFILSLPAQLSPTKLAARLPWNRLSADVFPFVFQEVSFLFLGLQGFFFPHCHCCARDGQWLGECSVLSEHLRRLTVSA